VTISGVMSPPTMVIFDEGNAVLKGLTFSQPTAWLATQLRRDPNLWNREWVIGQLTARADSADGAEAGAALAQAATGADYYLTRQQAAEALGSFPAAVALPALKTALRDTSAAVRTAAVEALGRLGGPEVVGLARDAFDHDSSYQVRAAAVATLGHADSAHAGQLIGEALTQPSYQDAILSAGLRLIVTTMDTARLGIVDSLMESNRTAGFVLAALGVRGSTRALDLLAGRLNDKRPTVRTWALQAFSFAMPPKLGLERLRAAVDGLTYADTRQQVSDAITRLARRVH